jgi:NAD(P)-dependent dehydrogenase (short-subunit alcohol dehydrogenase family)
MTEFSAGAIPGPVSKRFEGKVAVVAGGGMTDGTRADAVGIGAAAAILMALEGARVAVLDVSEEAARRTVDSIRAFDKEAIAIHVDVTDDDNCAAGMAEVDRRYGRLDALINSVGLSGGRRGVEDFDQAQWDTIMNVNLRGHILTCKHAIPLMREGGAIVNVSSADAVAPTYGSAVYASSKGGVNSLTQHIAVREGHRGIRANAVMPGLVWTAMTTRYYANPEEVAAMREFRRTTTATQTEGTSWDIAHACAFLASDQARYITGECIMLDGGAGRIGHWDIKSKPVRALPDTTLQPSGYVLELEASV